jgi:uncharacterized repeat protein (TIGR03803 family)
MESISLIDPNLQSSICGISSKAVPPPYAPPFGDKGDGSYVRSNLILDQSGSLYGNTFFGGTYGGGVVFKLSHANGAWFETILHNFGNGVDGSGPLGDIAVGPSGNLVGTTESGDSGDGIVWSITP